MFRDTDYNIFIENWIAYNAFFSVNKTPAECGDLFNAVKDFAPCTILQFEKQIKRNIAFGISPDKNSLYDLMLLASFDGRSKEQAKSIACKRWRILFQNADDKYDLCFSDIRACIAFYISFGTVKDFLNIQDKDKNENYLCKRFVDNYITCEINDNSDILNLYSIQKGWQKEQPRRVIVIGDLSEAKDLCNRYYGNNNWCSWRSDLYNRYYDLYFKDLQNREMVEDKEKINRERVALMQKVIDELEGKKTDLFLENK